MQSSQIRQKFFDYFVRHGHTKVASSSLIPADDPTLLFANAGMNQFKDLFLGKEKRSYTRAVSIQKCVRAGGKHNDLDNVGFTKRHLTFFEMMGNFSFGDYFKKEAIKFAWEFLTIELKLPKERLYASVFRDDQESYDIWLKEIGLSADHIVRLGEKDNFWQMGDTGPCGPCTEIYIDLEKNGCDKPCGPGCECDRFLEIWNNVFMQFDRQEDGTLLPLKQTGVDTGMGLERLAAVMENKDTVYHTDLFMPIIRQIEQLTGRIYSTSPFEIQAAFHVLADHIRSSSMIIADGGTPANEGRGYVLRKIIRRAALFSQKLTDKQIFAELVDSVDTILGSYYPELTTNKEKIKRILATEVEKFALNLVRGQELLNKYFETTKNKVVTGHEAFKLYDTYGFPLEITRIMAHERGFTVDIEGFENEMEQQRSQSGKKVATTRIELPESIKTTFTGYDAMETTGTIIGFIIDHAFATSVQPNTDCWIICDQSPFYVECGGQISDQGWITINDQKLVVKDLKKFDGAIGALVTTPTALSVGAQAAQTVDRQRRIDTMKNHTATHLLQAALIKVLGPTVKQSGSLVDPDYLRFDFTYAEPVSAEQIRQIETEVNNRVMENIPLRITWTTYQDALSRGVIAFFGEKYNPENVRIVEIPGASAELCGGTHVRATGDIGVFKITELTALSAGNRRIVALTGPKAVAMYQDTFNTVKTLSIEFKTPLNEVLQASHKQAEQLKEANTQIKQLKKQMIAGQLPVWLSQAELVGTIPYLFLVLPDFSAEELREVATQLTKAKVGFYFLISSTDEKSSFVAAASPELKLDLKKLQPELAKLGLRGGGSATSLQGGGPRLDTSWRDKIRDWLQAGTAA